MLKRMFVSAFAILAMTTAMVASAADTPAALNFKAKDIDGKEYVDLISSWWVNIHGHCHDHINQRIKNQSEKLEQVLFAGFTHHPAVKLAEELSKADVIYVTSIYGAGEGLSLIHI